MLLRLAALLLASAHATQPRPTKTWYEQAEADLLCTALAPADERASLGTLTIDNTRDVPAFTNYFRGAARDERQARIRHLAALAAVGWWANRVNDQSVRIDAYLVVALLSERYSSEAPTDPVFRQIARCASAQLISAAIELRRPAAADAMAARLMEQYRGGLPNTAVADWPLLLAVREARLDPTADTVTARLSARSIELAGDAMRTSQTVRASRLLATGAGALWAIGDTNGARDLALRSAAVTGTPPTIDSKWRAFSILFDSQRGLTGLADAAKLAPIVESTTPPAETDPRDLFDVYFRLSIAAEARGDFQVMGRHQLTAFRALARSQGGISTPSLLFYRTAIEQLLGRTDSSVATIARLDPEQGAAFVTSYLNQAAGLIGQGQREFVDDVRSRAMWHYAMDNVLFTVTDLARVRPVDRGRLTDASFQIAQARSFGRLNLAAITAIARRANADSSFRSSIDRFFSQATQNGTWLRSFLRPLVRRPGDPLPDGASVWRVMFAMDIFQNETTKALPAYLVTLRRTLPEVASLVIPQPLRAAEFQRRLQPDEALVATTVTSHQIYVWVLTRNGVTQVRQPVREADLIDRISRLRTSLTPVGAGRTTRLRDFDAAAAHDLYRWIFAPVADQLRGVRSVIWYGNGPLGSIPPAVLVTAPPAKPLVASAADLKALSFLVDRHAFSALPDLSLFPMFRDRPVARRGRSEFLGIGAPLVAADEIQKAQRSRSNDLVRGLDINGLAGLTKLEESIDEMKGLAAVFGEANSTLWLGPAADEQALANADLAKYGTLAFATHGFLADEVQNVREPSLMLALKPNAKDRFDGILTTTDIALLRLDADLVILSACNTGSADGRPSGETFTGLTQAFLTAGARNLMVSHWPVISGAAVRLSVETMQGKLRDGQSLPRSLQAAVQALRRDAGTALEAHPAYWGPFVIVGDGR